MSLRSFALRAAAVTVGAACSGALVAGPASAASGNIDHVEPDGNKLQMVVSLSELPEGDSADLETVTVSFDGESVPAQAEPLSESGAELRRTTVLAMDVSNSMKGTKFEEAKAAAEAFLDEVPE